MFGRLKGAVFLPPTFCTVKDRRRSDASGISTAVDLLALANRFSVLRALCVRFMTNARSTLDDRMTCCFFSFFSFLSRFFSSFSFFFKDFGALNTCI